MTDWDGEEYQRGVDEHLADSDNPHGEADFVQRYRPRSVLDAGCGTGRVAVELARRGVAVVGVDASESMLDAARKLDTDARWILADLADLDLGRAFDVVMMAGNVLLYTPSGTADVVAGCARHVAPSGVLVAGFRLEEDYPLTTYDAEARDAGLVLAERYATWHLDPFAGDNEYAVSVHRHAP